MSYPEFRSDLQRIHESEAYGLAVFETAAKVARSPERREKWLRLRALEKQTLERYLDYMQRTGQRVAEPRVWRVKGYLEGAALGLMPWRLAMTLVRNATGPFQETFGRLVQHADGPERDFFAYVLGHERAIEEFAVRELARHPASLDAVELLLAT